MWTYAQKTGALLQNGQLVATGYSGFEEGKNNPAMQAVTNVGPIPQGDWTIEGPPINTAEHGPFVLILTPSADTNTFGRSGIPDARRLDPGAWNRFEGVHHHGPRGERAGLEQRRHRSGSGA
jgi:hypothetical protein